MSGQKDSPPAKSIPKFMNFVIGGLSGMCATCIVQPSDLVKTRMQLMKEQKNISFLGLTKDILAKEGFKGFYKGLTAALLRQATYTTGRLGVFNGLMDMYKSTYGAVPPSLLEKIGIGMTAGAVGALVGNPAEVALIRMTADGRLPPEKRRNYKNVFDALSRIINAEGAFALMRGVSATIARAMVVNGAQLGSYTQARQMLLPSIGEGIPLHFTASMIAGLVTSAASLPVDIVKTRVQMSAKSASAIAVLSDVITIEGPLALWKGFWPTYLKIGPHTVLCFIFMEQLNALYLSLV